MKGQPYPPGVDTTMPDAARVMLQTKMLNDFLGPVYTLDDVSEMHWLTFDVLGAIRQALNPPKKDEK